MGTSTGGARRGHLVVAQSGGATAVINASLAGVVRAALGDDAAAIDGIYGARHGIEGVLRSDLLDLRRQPAGVWDRMAATPSAALGSCRYKLHPGDAERAVAILRSLGVRFFAYIGGNDSADTAHQLAVAAATMEYDLRVICVPKTIDNDLPATDHCPGYGSAGRFLALATMDSALCTAAMPEHYPVKLIEVMGRDAGWLAATTALGKRREDDPPHLIYFPERPLSSERFLQDIARARERYGYVVAVVAETVKDEQGRSLGALASQGTDAFGHPLLSGAAQYLVGLVRAELGLRARYDKPGDLQRMSSACVSPTDRAEAELAGVAAVRALVGGETDQMVTLVREPGPEYACTTGQVALERVANRLRPFPPEFMSSDGLGVTTAFHDYALPLVGELPQYPRLEDG